MPGVSKKSTMVSFRLDNRTIEKIKKALASPRNRHLSVSGYCKAVIESHAWRKH